MAKADQPRIQVTDKRGTGAGWEVQAAISPIKTSDDDVLAGANLKLVNRSVVTNSQNTSAAPVATDITLSSSQKTVFKADKDAGLGTWLDNFDKNTSVLTVYGGPVKAKTYNATITWTLTSGQTGE
ncbi:WxL domain-containing protein [Enterococcus saccharolyticus]|uniref:WxL domain-containing protein n=1 Tax=Enterococcus saccharolyticus TaxID=41997 RepID=UPI0039E03A60